MCFNEHIFEMNYCPRCGRITVINSEECFVCGHKTLYFESKWGITVEKYLAFGKQLDRGEINREQYDKAIEEYFKPFRDEVIKNHPEFDQYLYEHREEIGNKKAEEYWNKPSELPKYMQDAIKHSINSPTITCPYCKSIDTKKISAWQRGLSFSVFKFGSSKIGKQWHCNSCGSDF